MRITITTIGSRGDVQPYVALGSGLRAAGYEVRIASHANFRTLVRDRGLEFAPIAGDPVEILNSPDGKLLANGDDHHQQRFARQLWKLIQPQFRRISRDLLRSCLDSDLIVTSQLALPFAFSIAEKLGAPLVRAFTAPLTSTRTYPVPPVELPITLGGRLNLLTHVLSRQMFWWMIRGEVNSVRQDLLGLPPLPVRDPFQRMNRAGWPLLYGYSPLVAPRPHDWGDWITITGYWFLDRLPGWSPPAELVDFIEAGPPPVFVGFGSMPATDPEQRTRIVVGALKRARLRGVLAKGWGGLSCHDLTDDQFAVDEVPHDWLFPRMAAIVHHGGAGTTAASLRAGVPSVIIPHLPDQIFWGRRVRDIGAGVCPIPANELSSSALAATLKAAASDEALRERAAGVGARIRSEEGVKQAVVALNALCARSVR